MTEHADTASSAVRRPHWTLRTLLMFATCVAVLLAAINAFPGFFAGAFGIAIVFSPSILIATLATLFSDNRDRTLSFQIPAPILAPFFTPPIMAMTYWEDVYLGFYTMGMIAGAFSLTGALLDLVIRFAHARKAEQ